jgi:hypothetical protein
LELTITGEKLAEAGLKRRQKLFCENLNNRVATYGTISQINMKLLASEANGINSTLCHQLERATMFLQENFVRADGI